jgi:carboxylesterase type B
MNILRPIYRGRTQGVVACTAILALGVASFMAATSGATGAPAASSPPACATGTTVQTSSGPVCGIVTNGVTEWLGIPYAAPPVGALRWQPPQSPTPWTTTRPATAFGASCLQTPLAIAKLTTPLSENCLFVNVVRPVNGGSNLPVLVHIHGGGFTLGSGDEDYSPYATTGQDVVVAMNYRLGIFGFLADSALGPNSGDYGLQDQQAALRWVQKNISAFGGDPHNVTTFGESAGGSSQCDLIASPTARGLFNKAIAISGEYNDVTGAFAGLETQDCHSQLPTQQEADNVGAQFAAAAGCGNGDSAAVASCLRSLPADTAMNLAGAGYQLGGQGTVGPTLNGKTLVVSVPTAIRTGRINRVPLIAGLARDENLMGTPTTAAQYEQLVSAQYGKSASQVLSEYPVSHYDSPFIAWRTVVADSDGICSALSIESALARRMPVYAYETDDGDPPSTTPATTPTGSSHVAGGWLLPFGYNFYTSLDANQQVLFNEELTRVTAFARTGNPTGQGTIFWPRFNTTHNVLVLAPSDDTQLISESQDSADHHCGFWNRVAPVQFQ